MSFNNFGTPSVIGPATSAGPTSISWWYNFGDNRGAQYAMANIITPGGRLNTISQGNTLNPDGTVTYFVVFTNSGPGSVVHNLNGGGLV